MVVRDAPVVSHVEHPEQARRPRRVEVVDVTDPTPRMRRVRLAGDPSDLADLVVAGPTDHAKLFFPPAPGQEPPEPVVSARGLVVPPVGAPRPYREYTLRRHDPAAGTVDVDLVRHGGGLAGAWIEDPRGALWLLGPRSSAVVEPRDWYLLGGDETALPALARWVEQLPATARVHVVAEVADAAEEAYLGSAPAHVTVDWRHRGDAAPGTTTLLDEAVAAFTPPAGEGFAWMGAEAGALRPVRRRLRAVLPTAAVDLDGYWRRGVEGTGLG